MEANQQNCEQDKPTITHNLIDKNTIRQKNIYNVKDKGPYKIVFVRENINAIRLANTLKINNIKTIINLEITSKNSAIAIFKDRFEANKCISSIIMKDHDGYNCFIPNNFIYTEGLVRQIPTEESPEQLLKDFKSSVPIDRIERIYRWNAIKKERELSESVKITFRGNIIPPEIKYNDFIKLQVVHFIPNPYHCKNCLNYGHTQTRCRSLERCSTCAEIKEINHNCTGKTICLFCKEEHRTNDRENT